MNTLMIKQGFFGTKSKPPKTMIIWLLLPCSLQEIFFNMLLKYR